MDTALEILLDDRVSMALAGIAILGAALFLGWYAAFWDD